MKFDRIVSDPCILGGKPCIKGTRLSVQHILELSASGASRADILRAYRQLSPEDVEQAMLYAAQSMRNEVVVSVEAPA